MKRIVYSPEPLLKHPGQLFGLMIRDLLASRELAWRLIVRNFSAQYRQTMFGYLWAFLPPLALTAAFVFLSRQKIFEVEPTPVPYAVYVLIGTTLWQTFVDALNAPLRLVESSKAMLVKINFPREALLLAGLGEVVINLGIRAVLVAVVMAWQGIVPPATICLVPLGILVLIGLGTMFGVLLTPVGLLYQDISRSLVMITGFWMLLTPVVYPPKTEGWVGWLATWNPVSPPVLATRDWLTTGMTPHVGPFLVVALLAGVFLLVGWLLYRLAMPHLIARLGG